MTQFNSPTYDVERPSGQCAFSGRKLEVGESYMATLVELDPAEVALAAQAAAGGKQAGKSAPPPATARGLGFKRVDVSLDAWKQGNRPPRLFSYWRSRVPEANQKRRLFVDDEVLLNLFKRLADTTQPERLSFRFVLALILMRKKLLRYDSTVTKPAPVRAVPVVVEGNAESTADPAAAAPPPATDGEWWRMIPKGEIEAMEVYNPQLDEAQIQQVSQQLGEILDAEV